MKLTFKKKLTAKYDNELAELIARQLENSNPVVEYSIGDRYGIVSCFCKAFLNYDKNGIVSLADSRSNFTFSVEKFSIIGKDKISLQSKTNSMKLVFKDYLK